jgi:hypothetical protein
MNNSRRNELLAKAIELITLKVDGIYTSPRTYGVYRLTGKAKSGREFRFGNHPIRKAELINEYGGAEVVAVFLSRQDAQELASIENAVTK